MNVADFGFPEFKPYHVAFVTPNLEAGMRSFSGLYGNPEFMITRQAPIQTVDGLAYLDFALADMNGLRVELIEPKGGNDAIYREVLPSKNGETRFHHMACLLERREDWAQVLSTIEKNGLSTPIRGEAETNTGHYRYVYLDLRQALGHYLEFVHIS